MPTDADWGRLYNYDTTGDAGLVMPFRSYYFREFITNGWQEIVIGMIFRNSGNGGDTSSVTTERQNEITPANVFHFGLSKSFQGKIPVAANPYFMGLRGVIGDISQITDSPLQIANLKITGVNNGAAIVTGTNKALPLIDGTSSTPFNIVGLRFIANPLDQRVYVTYKFQTEVALADDPANTTTLTTFLEGISRDIADADAALPIWNLTNFPAFFVYWPYLNNKLMLQTVGVIKYD